jgi:hypothetical protein
MYESGTLYILFMFEHVALMATFRVLIQCIMITGIKIRKSFFLTRTYIRHQLLKTTLVVLIEKERVDIFHVFPSSSSSHQLYKKSNNDNYILVSIHMCRDI